MYWDCNIRVRGSSSRNSPPFALVEAAAGRWPRALVARCRSGYSCQALCSFVFAAASFSSLLSSTGSSSSGHSCNEKSHHSSQVRVWDAETLECEHVLPQPAGAEVFALLAAPRPGWGAAAEEMWGAVGEHVVVWGRD